MGGEHIVWVTSVSSRFGSSPHGWGTRWVFVFIVRFIRFIPTWVGNTYLLFMHHLSHAVHPHMGGEHTPSIASMKLSAGSSPHGWGTRLYLKFFLSIAAVHPHMGGEHIFPDRPIIISPGSSPHGWGTHIYILAPYFILRFIPTWVGNTSSDSRLARPSTVHPHMGGEHILMHITFIT